MIKLKESFYNMQINTKLMVLYIGAIVVPILLIFSVFLSNIVKETNEREKVAREAAFSRTIKKVDDIFDDMQRIGLYFSVDEELHYLIEDLKTDTLYDAYSTAKTINRRIDIITSAYDNIYSIVLYHTREDFLNITEMEYIDDEVRDSNWYKEYAAEVDLKGFYYTFSYDKDMSLVLINSFSPYMNQSDSFFRQEISSDKIAKELQDSYLIEESVVYLLDSKNVIVSSSNDLYDTETDVQYFDESQFSNEGSLYYVPLVYESFTEGWKLVFWINQPGYINNLGENIIQLIISMLGVFIISFILIWAVSTAIGKRLGEISKVMKESQKGALILVKEDSSQDEIGTVFQSYNRLIDRIKTLLIELRINKDKSDKLLEEKVSAFEELEATNEELAKAYEDLTSSFEEIRIMDIKIEELIFSDLLTGLNNRFSITRIIEKGLDEEGKMTQAVIFVDVDNFKFINDTYGHDVGDLVIKDTGGKLKSFESEFISIGRFGGDEFLIFIEDCNGRTSIVSLLESIKNIFMEPINVEDKRFYLTVSMGIAICPDHARNRNGLIKNADTALYRSKERGRNCYTFYESSFDEGLEHRILLQNAINDAFKNKEFYLSYQPYVACEDGRLKGYEALIRWHSKEFGQVSSYELITVAEQMGIIIEIGDWIIEEAMMFIKEVNENKTDRVTVSINISPVQLMSKGFVERLIGITKAVGVSPMVVCLEMTETVLIDSFTRRGNDLQVLSKLGYGISLDDFGTGYSSLSYFRELPVTVLKIDKSFIDEIVDSAFNQELVHVMAVTAHVKGIKVTAEGVETKEQLDVLKQYNIDNIQGYYFSRPLSRKDALEYKILQ